MENTPIDRLLHDYISGRISFCKSLFLGIFQNIIVIQTVFRHLRENIVCRTVDDAENFIEII